MRALPTGARGKDVKRLQGAIGKRARARDAPSHVPKIDGVLGSETRMDMYFVCYLLGMELEALKHLKVGPITTEEQLFVLDPSRRTNEELARARIRAKAYKQAQEKQKKRAKKMAARRRKIVALAEEAAANYRKNPRAYHYLAGGVANTVFLKPTPRGWRSDCSQFVAAIYRAAGLPSPADPLDHKWASTYSIVKSPRAKVISRAQRKPGDLGMYGSREAPYHVELWCGDKFIGHGSQPIDSNTPGQPDYYITFDFLN